MRPVKALFFDLDETLLDGSGLQESIVQTCKVIAASKSGLEARDLVEANKKIWPDYFREAEHKWKLGALDGASVGLEEWRRTLRMCGRNDESLADFAVRTLRGLAEIVCLTTVIPSGAKSSTN
jgi:FMN phosphatase YigB (HAD superfamily)